MRRGAPALALAAALAVLGGEARAGTKCYLGGTMVMVQRVPDNHPRSQDPRAMGPAGQVDPWKLYGTNAAPEPTLWLMQGDWEVGAAGDVSGDGLCDVVWMRWQQ